MSARYTVRPYAAADHEACAALFSQVMHETFPEDDPAIYAADSFTDLTAGEEIWVAEAGAQIVGLISFWPAEPFVHLLLILPRWRRRGIGSALIQAATGNVAGAVELKCRVENEGAQRFYTALGWKDVGRTSDGGASYIRYRLKPGCQA